MKSKLCVMLATSDTNPIRLLAGLAAGVWCISLLIYPESIYRPIYAPMTYIMPAEAWALVFGTNSLALIWRVCNRAIRPKISLLINSLTLCLWCFVTTMSIMNLGEVAPALGPNIALTIAMFWVVIRTRYSGGR